MLSDLADKILRYGLTFEQLFGTSGREFDRQKSKNSNAWGFARGWGWGLLRLQIDRCITV